MNRLSKTDSVYYSDLDMKANIQYPVCSHILNDYHYDNNCIEVIEYMVSLHGFVASRTF